MEKYEWKVFNKKLWGKLNISVTNPSAPYFVSYALCGDSCVAQTFINSGTKYRSYRKFPKSSDIQNICCNHTKIWTMWLSHRVMSPNDADGMAKSADPDQTAPLESTLFAQAYLSGNLGSLRYYNMGRLRK